MTIQEFVVHTIKKSLEHGNEKEASGGISCYRQIYFDYAFYNTPYNYEIQSGSIPLYQNSYELFQKKSFHRDQLFNALGIIYNFSVDCLKKANESDFCLNIIHNISELLYCVVLYKVDTKVLRVQIIRQLPHHLVSLYKIAFERNIFDEKLFVYQPFYRIIFQLNKMELEEGRYIFDAYKEWCQFVMIEHKQYRYVIDCVESAISFIKIQISHIEILKEGSDNENLERSNKMIIEILGLYSRFNYTLDNFSERLISEIHSMFWFFRQFDMRSNEISEDFIKNVDQILEKTHKPASSLKKKGRIFKK